MRAKSIQNTPMNIVMQAAMNKPELNLLPLVTVTYLPVPPEGLLSLEYVDTESGVG